LLYCASVSLIQLAKAAIVSRNFNRRFLVYSLSSAASRFPFSNLKKWERKPSLALPQVKVSRKHASEQQEVTRLNQRRPLSAYCSAALRRFLPHFASRALFA
jgi:hypothetical protein